MSPYLPLWLQFLLSISNPSWPFWQSQRMNYLWFKNCLDSTSKCSKNYRQWLPKNYAWYINAAYSTIFNLQNSLKFPKFQRKSSTSCWKFSTLTPRESKRFVRFLIHSKNPTRSFISFEVLHQWRWRFSSKWILLAPKISIYLWRSATYWTEKGIWLMYCFVWLNLF